MWLPFMLLLVFAGLAKATRGSGGHRRARAGGWAESRSEPGATTARSIERGAATTRSATPGACTARSVEPRARRAHTEATPRRTLPIDVEAVVEQIRRKADLLLGQADRFPPFSHDLHLVRQTASDYLPHTIAAYLALPGDDDPTVPTTGTTALEELRAQLGLLSSKLDDITLNLQRSDLEHLAANRRFLEDRFRPGGPGAPMEPSPREMGAA